MPPCTEHSQLAAAVERLEQRQKDQGEDIRRIVVAVCGDLEERQAGLLHRVRILEQDARTRARVFWITITAAIAAIIGAGISLIH